MANRSYLYAIDFDPSERTRLESDVCPSIGEWSYGVPLTFRILLSSNTREVPSLLFNYENPIALLGDYTQGLERLNTFLDSLPNKEMFDSGWLEEEIANTNSFFKGITPCKYFLLECGELYDMVDEEYEVQNRQYLQLIQAWEKDISQFADTIRDMNDDDRIWELGLGNWSDILFYCL